MAGSPSNPLDQIIHDVNSKCASLRSAAGLLKDASPEEQRELIKLMADEAQSLFVSISKGSR